MKDDEASQEWKSHLVLPWSLGLVPKALPPQYRIACGYCRRFSQRLAGLIRNIGSHLIRASKRKQKTCDTGERFDQLSG